MRISDWSSDVCSSDLRIGDVMPYRPSVAGLLLAAVFDAAKAEEMVRRGPIPPNVIITVCFAGPAPTAPDAGMEEIAVSRHLVGVRPAVAEHVLHDPDQRLLEAHRQDQKVQEQVSGQPQEQVPRSQPRSLFPTHC